MTEHVGHHLRRAVARDRQRVNGADAHRLHEPAGALARRGDLAAGQRARLHPRRLPPAVLLLAAGWRAFANYGLWPQADNDDR